jgi:hypothetical protein
MLDDSTPSTKDTQKAAIIVSLGQGASVTEATKAADVDRTTYYFWRHEDETFAGACDAAKRSRVGIAKDVAFTNALKSEIDPRYQTSLIAWLNNEGGWSNPQRHEVTGADGGPLKVQIYLPDNGRDVPQE